MLTCQRLVLQKYQLKLAANQLAKGQRLGELTKPGHQVPLAPGPDH